MTEALAIGYAGLAALPMAMHLALAAGAPWGRYTLGGRFSGRLPPVWRALAIVQGAILAAMAGAVLARAGIGRPALAVLFWSAVAVTVLSLLANTASPSRPERRLWTPVLASMAFAALGVAFF